MAFDRSNQAHLTALKALVLAGGFTVLDGTSDILAYVNLPENNLGGETGPDSMTGEALLKIVFAENISAGNQFRIQLLFEATNGLTDDMSRFKSDVSALDAGLLAAINLLVRDLSLAEVAFSEDDANGVRERVTISSADWAAARDNG